MKLLNWIRSIFESFNPEHRGDFMYRNTGVFKDEEDYRDIYVSMFQKQIEPLPAKHITDISMLDTLDQGQQPACVGHALAVIIAYYYYKETGILKTFSARFIYGLCKIFDGIRMNQGTYPRVGANVVTKYGASFESSFKNDISLTMLDYIEMKDVPPEVFSEAANNRTKGFARVDETVDAIKLALVKNSLLTASFRISTWASLPLQFFARGSWHYVVIYGYEVLEGKTRLYIRNSWSKVWLSWVYNWLFPGNGYLVLEDYIQNACITDIYAFTDIPNELLAQSKGKPYKFARTLNTGMSGVDVMELQKFLNEDPMTAVGLDGPGSRNSETSLFGPATFRALKVWQFKNGIKDTGTFGPISIAKANLRIPKKGLIDALIQVESGGNDNAIGDKHLTHWAYGCLQIRQPMVTDVNRYLGTSFKAQDCLGNRKLSIQIYEAYFVIYPHNKTDEQKAKAWNGGGNWKLLYGKKGYESYTRNLDTYWAKIKKLLN